MTIRTAIAAVLGITVTGIGAVVLLLGVSIALIWDDERPDSVTVLEPDRLVHGERTPF